MTMPARIVKWTGAALVVSTGHAAIAMWLAMPKYDGGPVASPKPVFVELQPAELPPASAAEAVDPVTEAVSPPEPAPEPAAETVPQRLSEAEPTPEAIPEVPPSALPPLVPLPPLTNVAELVVPTGEARVLSSSQRPEPRPERRRSQQATPDAGQPAAKTRAAGQEKPATLRQTGAASSAAKARPPAAQTAPRKSDIASWQASVGARIARHMARTRLSGRGGATVQIAVTIAPNGATSARLVTSSGNPGNDAALKARAARMPSMPAPPGGRAQSFVLPIRVR